MNDIPLTLDDYAKELTSVIGSLSESEKPTLVFGHSFGGGPVVEAMLQGLPVAGAVLADAFDSGAMVQRGVTYRISQLPQAARDRLSSIPKDNTDAVDQFLGEFWFPNHFCRLDPWPESLLDAMGKLNPTLMTHFIGANVLTLDGATKDWSVEERLAEIQQPVLVVSGKYDYYREDDVMRMASLFPDGTAWISQTASHTPWLEDPENFKTCIDSFLDRFR
jgi:proline iminopeptidase